MKHILYLVLLFSPTSYAAWVGPNEALSGNWGNGSTEFFVDWGDVPAFAVYPGLSDIAGDGMIAISDNGHFKLYSANGQWVRNITPPYDPNKWGLVSVFVGGNILLPTNNYYFISREGVLLKQLASPVEKMAFQGEINGNLYVAERAPNEQWLVYSSDGVLLNTYTEKPLELGRITHDIFGFQGKKTHRFTITFPDKQWSIVSPSSVICGEYNYFRDSSGNLYCAGDNNVVRYSACGKEVASFTVPDDNITTLLKSPPGSGVEDIVQVEEGYGSIVMADNGDVYTSKVTPTNFSVIKWAWQASPADKVGGPDAPTDFVANVLGAEVKLVWRPSLQDPGCVTGYEVSRATVSGGAYTVLTTTSADVKDYTDTTVQSGNTYYYKVRALSAVANSDYTNEATVIVP